jgi:hypothetical protein
MLSYQKPMFSDDERRPLMTEDELRDACLRAAATIVVATMFGCEFEDRRLNDDGYPWPTSVSRIELKYPKDWAREEALSGVAAIYEAGSMAVAKHHSRGAHHINVSGAARLLDDSRIWNAIEALAQFVESDGSEGCYGAMGTDAGDDSPALNLIKSMDLPSLTFA